MKRIAAIALLVVASTLGAGHALAQASINVRVNMPFDFTVGNKVLPAGAYTITPILDDAIEIRNNKTYVSAVTSVTPDSTFKPGCNLVFDNYGGRYFLREVEGGPSALNVFLPEAKSEQRARTQKTMAYNQAPQVSIPATEGN